MICLFLVCVALFAFTSLPLFNQPANFPKPIYPIASKPLSIDKINLGKALFYDNILSYDSTISCASCHISYTAFAHTDHSLSHGIQGKIGKRNAPALQNLAWVKMFMWDGAIHHLDVQALAPIHHPDEMNERLDHVIEKLNRTTRYKILFYRAYHDSIATGERTLLSISQFLLTLVSADSRYDSVKKELTQFTQQEQNGYEVFKQYCNACHTEPLFTNNTFRWNGLPLDTNLQDKGRMQLTHKKSDSLQFKVPSLRNIAYTFPYMHDGRMKSLTEVLTHYTNMDIQSKQLPPELRQKMNISPTDKVDLIAFLLTLTDKNFLFNPVHQYPRTLFQLK